MPSVQEYKINDSKRAPRLFFSSYSLSSSSSILMLPKINPNFTYLSLTHTQTPLSPPPVSSLLLFLLCFLLSLLIFFSFSISSSSSFPLPLLHLLLLLLLLCLDDRSAVDGPPLTRPATLPPPLLSCCCYEPTRRLDELVAPPAQPLRRCLDLPTTIDAVAIGQSLHTHNDHHQAPLPYRRRPIATAGNHPRLPYSSSQKYQTRLKP